MPKHSIKDTLEAGSPDPKPLSDRGPKPPRASPHPLPTPHLANRRPAAAPTTNTPTLLEKKGSYMHESACEISDESEQLVVGLLQNEQPPPQGTLCDDDIVKGACFKLVKKNEASVIDDIMSLIEPSAESLSLRNNKYKHLVESYNE
jgi:hypothetical protein